MQKWILSFKLLKALMRKPVKIFLFCMCSLTLIGCDRYTKILAKNQLLHSEALSFFHDTFRLQYAENTGAALGLGDNLSKQNSLFLLSIIPLMILLIALFYTIKNVERFSLIKLFSFCLIIAGGLGNVIDRLLFERMKVPRYAATDFLTGSLYTCRNQ